MNLVVINCNEIVDWNSFHAVFKKAFGFPEFYGQNMDAWIDCMTYLDTDFSTVQVEEGEILTLQLDNIRQTRETLPDIYNTIIECSAFVNWRRVEQGNPPILALSFYQ